MRSFTTIFYFAPLATAIWPLPVIYEHGETVIWIKKNVSIHWYETGQAIADAVPAQVPFVFASNSNTETGTQVNEVKLGRRLIDPAKNHLHGEYEDSEEVTDDHIIEFAIKSAWKTIFEHNLYPWKFHSRNWTEPSPQDVAIQVSRVDIKLLSRSTPHPNGEVDESYTIDLTEEGRATISANSSVGISHGLTTFTQLFYAHSNAEDAYTPFAPLHIFDAPVFQHRGINLDVSRHYFSVSDIKRQIDACAYNKMNRFHLHVTDSQAWPLEIPSLPSLARNGAYRPDLTYTPHDFAEIQRHAALQGVQVITEIDMPGHTSSIYHAFPELIAAFDMQPDWDTYAAEPPSGTLKLNSTAVDDFLETLFDDLLPRVAPYSEYFHTGGDEVNMNAYMLDDTVKSNKFEVLQPLMQRFVEKNHERVRRRGLTPVVWEEMLLEWNLTLGDDVVVQSWRSDEAVKKIVERGHKALVGNYKYWYLDCGKGQWLDFDPTISSSYWPYNDYCAPFHNWRLAYSYDPFAGIPLEHQHLVLGGEAHMWAEQTDPVNIDQMIWPRGSAVAEILWSGPRDAQGRNRSQIEASPRLSEMRERLVAMGIRAEPIQMPYCTMEGTVCQMGWGGR